MSEEYDDAQQGDDGGPTGPGAPTPLSALEVFAIDQHLGIFERASNEYLL